MSAATDGRGPEGVKGFDSADQAEPPARQSEVAGSPREPGSGKQQNRWEALSESVAFDLN